MCAGSSRPAPTSITPDDRAPGIPHRESPTGPGATMGECNGRCPRPSPTSPGSYQFKDARRPRHLRRQGQEPAQPGDVVLLAPACRSAPAQMVSTADTVEWIAVRNEVEALFLEFNLIKKHRPRFNIRLKDDKSYPYLAITLDEEWPRAMVMRGAKRKGVRYFGPYAHAYAIRETLDLLLRTFPIRTCTKGKFDRHAAARPPVPLRAHREVRGAVRRRGHPRGVHGARRRADRSSSTATPRRSSTGSTSRCTRRATRSSSSGRHACATRSSRCARRSSASRWSTPRRRTTTLIGMVDDPLEASVQVFLVRKGRVVGRKGLVVDKVEDVDAAGAGRPPARAALRRRSRAPTSPARSSCPSDPDDVPTLRGVPRAAAGEQGARPRAAARRRSASCWRRSRRTRRRRSPATSCKRASDHNARARALLALQDALGLPEAPLRIECFDISNLQGTEIVASMVVMEDGLPKRSDYRRFKIRHQPGQDDFAAMEEVADPAVPSLPAGARRRRAQRASASRTRRTCCSSTAARASSASRCACSRSSGSRTSAVASLAKRFEEVYVPGRSGAGAHPARLRGAVPAAAGPRRGPPLRDHVPPPAAGQEDDQVGARRRARARAHPPRPAAQGARLGQAAARADRGRARGDPVAPRDGRRTRSTRSCTARRLQRPDERRA